MLRRLPSEYGISMCMCVYVHMCVCVRVSVEGSRCSQPHPPAQGIAHLPSPSNLSAVSTPTPHSPATSLLFS